ncbi:hypothetical protein [Bradyrhizobium sp. ARR65]|uniref:hypothetical protein n=1 Tax=Bradyrhizobium sp. ARR65 TaxID=1040989 RepID=UPI0004667296|nr:hypothetical protein [Bradyrhizobium sp. ARR65]
MKSLAVILSIALSGAVWSIDITTASATRMDGKCCQSSDGGRSYRYRMSVLRAQIPRSCSAYAASCIRFSSSRPDRVPMCTAAKAQCMQSGTYIGPYSGRWFTEMQKI